MEDASAAAREATAPTSNRAWESVRLARNVHRPTALAYIDSFVDGFIELHGDRMFGDDGAVVCGLGWIEGRAVTVIAREEGRDLKAHRATSRPRPEGWPQILRLMRQAEVRPLRNVPRGHARRVLRHGGRGARAGQAPSPTTCWRSRACACPW